MSLFIIFFLLLSLWRVGRNLVGKNDEIPLWPVLSLALFALVLMSSYGYLHDWDERFHALVGKHMAGNWLAPTLITDPVPGFDETEWGLSNIWLHKQPVTAWCIGLAMHFLGDACFVARLPSLLFTLAAVYCTFRIGELLFSRNVGVVAALLYASNGKVLETAAGLITTDHVDTIFSSLIAISVFFVVRYAQHQKLIDGVMVGIGCGLAVLTKWLTALVVLPLLFYLLWSSQGKLVRGIWQVLWIGGITVVVFLPWQLYILDQFPVLAETEYAYNRKHITDAIEGHEGSWWFYLDGFRRVFGETIFLVFGLLAFRLYKTRSSAMGFLFVWLLVPLLFFSVVETKMNGYLLLTYPAVCLMVAVGIKHLSTYVLQYKGWKRYALGTIMFAALSLPVRYGVERMKLFQDVTTLPAWQTEINAFTESRAVAKKKTLVFGDDKYVQLMFADDNVTAYPMKFRQAYLAQIDTSSFDIFFKIEGDGATSYVQLGSE